MNVALPECPGRLPALPQHASAGQRCVLRDAHWRRSLLDIARTAFINAHASACVGLRIPRATCIGVLTRTATPGSP
jgi:hypothetical protein